MPSSSTWVSYDGLPGGVTRSFIPEGSGLLGVFLNWVAKISISLNYKHDKMKRNPKKWPAYQKRVLPFVVPQQYPLTRIATLFLACLPKVARRPSSLLVEWKFCLPVGASALWNEVPWASTAYSGRIRKQRYFEWLAGYNSGWCHSCFHPLDSWTSESSLRKK